MTKRDFIDRVGAADRWLVRWEIRAASALVATLVVTLAAGAGLRAVGRPPIWADELAVLLMCAATFVGASALVGRQGHVAMTLVAGRLPARARRAVALLRDLAVLGLIAALSALVWRWFDPVGLLRHGSAEALARVTMNFIYTDPTATLGVVKAWFWAAMPVFCLGALVHAAVQVIERLAGRAPC